ncbi:putative thioredoxin [Rubricella aquisinus]|uniref:Thioredoxin n=1 Tax=Rubricella aquisinus TaxID=2028108 RepID=A0A840WXE8_9RHOB|nr:thioredoxin [Rubricella aquisinus]MBB5514355.1 putative thioredoxin [Rubricella aquisinus]
MIELGQGTAPADLIKDGSEATFMADVIEASNEVPVIVDFWAPWCGPCKTLTPVIEGEVKNARGAVKLVKINVDENQRIAAQAQVQSIPTVIAVVGGQVVDSFQGALPASQVKQFIDRVVKAGGGAQGGGIEEAIAMANEMLDQGAVADAAQTFAAILGEVPDNLDAQAGLARVYLAMGETDKAQAIIDAVPEHNASHPEIAAVRAQIALSANAGAAGELAELSDRVTSDPTDKQARLDYANALIGAGQNDEAIDMLLELFRQDREWQDSAAKETLFKLFDALGPKDPLVASGRRRLSSMIFA